MASSEFRFSTKLAIVGVLALLLASSAFKAAARIASLALHSLIGIVFILILVVLFMWRPSRR